MCLKGKLMGNVLFGPAGNSESFYNEGHKSSLETAKWVKDRGLDIFEYSFGQGYRMNSETATKLGENKGSNFRFTHLILSILQIQKTKCIKNRLDISKLVSNF